MPSRRVGWVFPDECSNTQAFCLRETQFVSMFDDLERLGRLRNSGDISEQEFSALKARLISGHGISDPNGPPEEDPSTESQDSLRDAGAVDKEPPLAADPPAPQQPINNPVLSESRESAEQRRQRKDGERRRMEGVKAGRVVRPQTAQKDQNGCLVVGLVGAAVLVIAIAIAGASGGSGGSGGNSELDNCVAKMNEYSREIATQSCKLSLIEKYGD